MKNPSAFLIAVALATVAIVPAARPAQADTASTVAIIAAASVIVGAILVDSNNQPYYVNNGRHVYVSQNTATYYRANGNSRNHGQPQHGNGQQNNGQYHGQQYGGQQGH
jgi:hypothetical protein